MSRVVIQGSEDGNIINPKDEKKIRSYKITRLVRQIMEIKEGKKHNQKNPQKTKQQTPSNQKTQLLGSPLLAIVVCTLKSAF